jgi:hypothetical protein
MCYSAALRHIGFFSACLCVLITSQFPRRSECARKYILARRPQPNMRVSHFSPPARDWQENLWRLLHKRCLLLQRKHQISVALCLRGERSKFSTAYPKCRQSRVRVLFHAFQAQGNPAKVSGGHVAIPIRHREYRISPLADGSCLLWADHGLLFPYRIGEELPTIHSQPHVSLSTDSIMNALRLLGEKTAVCLPRERRKADARCRKLRLSHSACVVAAGVVLSCSNRPSTPNAAKLAPA